MSQATRTCLTCGEDFEVDTNYRARYCPDHLGGKPTQEEIKLAASMKARDYFDEWLSRRVDLPEVPTRIRATKATDMGFDTEQHMVAMLSDAHYGSYIDPRVTGGLAFYDLDLARARGAKWRDGVLRFTQQDQLSIPVKTLHLFALGDDIEGHGDMFATQKLSMTDSVGFVMWDFVVDMSELLLSLLNRYEKIIIYKVRGNHGRIAQTAKADYPPDNLELSMWHTIASTVGRQTGGEWTLGPNGVRQMLGGKIDFYIYSSIMAFVQIFDHTFGLRHGDGVKGIASTYTGLVDNKLRMNAILGEVLNYYLIAHHHEAQSIENEIGGESMVNGCWVGPSLLSVKMQRPAASIPSQEMFLLHPSHGITNRHRIRLATKAEMRSLISWTGREVSNDVGDFLTQSLDDVIEN